MSFDVPSLRAREFPWAASGESIFLNHASTGPLPQRAVDALEKWSWLRANPDRLSHDLQFDTLARSRALLAELVGADPGEIALATNTSFGINLAAFGLPLGPGDVVLTPDAEFPANVYPWIAGANRRGFEYRRIPLTDGITDTATILRALDAPGVRALAVSWVGFASGARVDLGALGAACRARGVYFVVDGIQGLGPLPLNLRDVHADVFACGAQKWLLSPWGSGFVYVRRELIPQLEPHDVSWMAVKNSDDFSRLVDYDLTWREDARRFEFITLPFQDFAGMNASVELLLELGPEAVASHVAALADLVIEWVEDRDDVRLLTPCGREDRAGILALCPREPAAASARLRAGRVAHSFREGAIRLAPYAYNTPDEIRRALTLLVGG